MRSENSPDVLIVGGGVTGLTLALSLHQAAIPCRVFEAATELKWLGVGINLLPHAVRELTELGLAEQLERRAVATREMCFYNRFGQFVYKEPRGRYAGYDWPQFSLHRGRRARRPHGKIQARRRLRARGAESTRLARFTLRSAP